MEVTFSDTPEEYQEKVEEDAEEEEQHEATEEEENKGEEEEDSQSESTDEREHSFTVELKPVKEVTTLLPFLFWKFKLTKTNQHQ